MWWTGRRRSRQAAGMTRATGRSGGEHENSNELAAQAIARHVLGRRLTKHELRVAAPLMHYVFGASVAAVYGAYAQRKQSQMSGVGFGTTVWLAADEIAMPLLGLSDSTS